MQTEDSSKITSLDFLKEPKAKELFAKIDFLLKEGYHIQDRSPWQEHFRFVARLYDSIDLYYQEYYGIKLSYGGTGTDKYYYLEFVSGTRGEIKSDHYQYLDAESIITGFLLYKVVYIDRNISLSSSKELQRIIRNDYEDLKPDIIKTLARSKYGKASKTTDDTIDSAVERSLKAFHKLGWVEKEGDQFEVLPAFQRIITIYGDIINNLEDWCKENS